MTHRSERMRPIYMTYIAYFMVSFYQSENLEISKQNLIKLIYKKECLPLYLQNWRTV